MGYLICGLRHPLLGPCELPLCARCTGLYLTLAACALVFLLRRGPRPERRLIHLLIALGLIAVAPIHALFFNNAADLARFAAGALAGAGIAALVGGSAWPAAYVPLLFIALAATRSGPVFLAFAWLTLPAVLVALGWPVWIVVRNTLRPRPVKTRAP